MKELKFFVIGIFIFAFSAIDIYAVNEDEYRYKDSDYVGDYEKAPPGLPTKDQAVKALYSNPEGLVQLKEKNLPTKNFFAIIVYTVGKGRRNATALQPYDECIYTLYIHFPKEPDGSHRWCPATVTFLRDVSTPTPGKWEVEAVEYVLDQNEYPHKIGADGVDRDEMRLRSE
jgi:hypothetical protein